MRFFDSRKTEDGRPAIPAIFVFAAVIWLTVALSWESAFTIPVAIRWIFATLACVLGVAGAFCSIRVSRMGFIAGIAAAFVLGLAITFSQSASIDGLRLSPDAMNEETVLVALESGVEHFGSTRFEALAVRAGSPVKVELDTKGAVPVYGEAIKAHIKLVSPIESRMARCNRDGIVFTAALGEWERVDRPSGLETIGMMRSSLLEEYSNDNDGGALMRAIIYGDRSGLSDTELYDAFKACGLAHVVAVSGAHLVIVSSFVSFLLARMRLAPLLSGATQIAFLAFYLFLTGMPLSCLRASIMSCISLLSCIAGRRNQSLAALGVVIMVVCAISPSDAISVSFVLSALATAGIVIFTPLFQSWLERSGLPRKIIEPLAMTCAATMPTVAVTAPAFAQFSLIAPIANVVAAPALTVLCGLGMGAAAMHPVPMLGTLLASLASSCAQVVADVVLCLAAIPYASIPVDCEMLPVAALIVVICAALWWFWPQGPTMDAIVAMGLSLLVVVAIVRGALGSVADELIVLDVGQGDAIALRSQGTTVLVDTGTNDTMLLKALARHGITKIDAVLITHPDDDHCGSLQALASNALIGEVILAEGLDEVDDGKCQALLQTASSAAGGRVSYVSTGDRFGIGRFNCDIIAPQHIRNAGANSDSICFVAEIDCDGDGAVDWRSLLCGDAESKELEGLVEEGLLGDIDVLKVGHHGSKPSTTPELLDALTPSVALVSAGAHNRYGHPADITLANLNECGAQVFRTDVSSDIVVGFELDRMRIKTRQ